MYLYSYNNSRKQCIYKV